MSHVRAHFMDKKVLVLLFLVPLLTVIVSLIIQYAYLQYPGISV